MAFSSLFAKTCVKWLEIVNIFYSLALTDNELQSKFARLRVKKSELKASSEQITKLGSALTAYLRELGESQAATKAKDAAFSKLDDWMSEFYAIARIGLEDNPQLLEAFG